jgi:hypothetical protein
MIADVPHKMASDLARHWHAEDGSNPVTIAHFARRTTFPIKPSRKIPEFDFMFNSNVCD